MDWRPQPQLSRRKTAELGETYQLRSVGWTCPLLTSQRCQPIYSPPGACGEPSTVGSAINVRLTAV